MSTPNKEPYLSNEILTVKEVAAYLRVSRVTVWRWCQQRIIPAFRINRNWHIRRDDLLYLLANSQLPGPSHFSFNQTSNQEDGGNFPTNSHKFPEEPAREFIGIDETE